jgi:hypothetical protein
MEKADESREAEGILSFDFAPARYDDQIASRRAQCYVIYCRYRIQDYLRLECTRQGVARPSDLAERDFIALDGLNDKGDVLVLVGVGG